MANTKRWVGFGRKSSMKVPFEIKNDVMFLALLRDKEDPEIMALLLRRQTV